MLAMENQVNPPSNLIEQELQEQELQDPAMLVFVEDYYEADSVDAADHDMDNPFLGVAESDESVLMDENEDERNSGNTLSEGTDESDDSDWTDIDESESDELAELIMEVDEQGLNHFMIESIEMIEGFKELLPQASPALARAYGRLSTRVKRGMLNVTFMLRKTAVANLAELEESNKKIDLVEVNYKNLVSTVKQKIAKCSEELQTLNKIGSEIQTFVTHLETYKNSVRVDKLNDEQINGIDPELNGIFEHLMTELDACLNRVKQLAERNEAKKLVQQRDFKVMTECGEIVDLLREEIEMTRGLNDTEIKELKTDIKAMTLNCSFLIALRDVLGS